MNKGFLKLEKNMVLQTIDIEDFNKIDLRIGTIIQAEVFEKARKSAYKIWVDLGSEIGIKKSSAQVTELYLPKDLIDMQVLCVCNLKPRQIAGFWSEVLVTGFIASGGGVVLASAERSVPNGSKLH